MLYPPLNVNPIQEGVAKARSDSDVKKRSFDEGDKPGGEAHASEDLKGPLVVDRVKGLRRVEKEAKVLLIQLDTFEEELVYIADVIHTILAPEEAFLGRFDESSNSRHNKVGHSRGQEAVIGVGDADGAGVGDQPRRLLRDEEKDPMVEPRRRRAASANGLEHGREEGAGDFSVGPPSGKRDTIRTRGG